MLISILVWGTPIFIIPSSQKKTHVLYTEIEKYRACEVGAEDGTEETEGTVDEAAEREKLF